MRRACAAAIAALLLTPAPAAAEPWRLSLDTDPTNLALAGGSAWLTARPPGARVRLGLGGVTVALPGALLPDGWGLRMTGLMGNVLFDLGRPGVDAYGRPDRSGAYAGAYLGYWRDDYTRQAALGETAVVDNVALIPAIGYQWFPAGRGFYVQPWLGLKLWLPLRGQPVVGGRTFPLPPALPVPGLQIGWEI